MCISCRVAKVNNFGDKLTSLDVLENEDVLGFYVAVNDL